MLEPEFFIPQAEAMGLWGFSPLIRFVQAEARELWEFHPDTSFTPDTPFTSSPFSLINIPGLS